VQVAEPIPDPGIEPHELRITDIDPAAADRVERQVATMFSLAGLLALGACVAYFAIPRDSVLTVGPLSGNANNLTLGLCLGLALFLIGAGAIQWAKKLMVDTEISEERHDAHSSPAQKADIIEGFQVGVAESGFTRRKLIRRSLIGATAQHHDGAGPQPLQHHLGQGHPGRQRRHAPPDQAVRPDRRPAGQRRAGQPGADPGGEPGRVPERQGQGRGDHGPDRPGQDPHHRGAEELGHRRDPVLLQDLHVGCPISLYEQTTHHVLCPCHQSTFDLSDGAKVVFGPAARPLPQLPLAVDAEGYIVAQSGFTEPVGPSFWERG
jgi:ubiquinol-cytochrome c reductase iron-sulfur subunit